jgi:hypothetical protein
MGSKLRSVLRIGLPSSLVSRYKYNWPSRTFQSFMLGILDEVRICWQTCHTCAKTALSVDCVRCLC